MIAKSAPNHKLLDIINVVRTRSHESTEPVDSPFKSQSTSLMTPASQRDPWWRTNVESSIFRSKTTDVSEIPDMLCIKRCLAFDDGEDD
jgi:hypothetical protein